MRDAPDLPKLTELDAMLCFDAYAVNLAFGRIYKALLDPLGITYPQFLVLLTLWAQDSQSVGALGDHLGLDSSTLTPLIKRLGAADLVTRQRDARDERRVIVSLTPRGHALQAKTDHVRGSVNRATGLSEAEQLQLRDLLQRTRSGLLQS
ncbi:MarR family winged helix-turn-helix transcriptional regulator [Paracoccus nototheniae]|uniref:MarR family winged helix-turn-helix transcriptional regulator n=1 Tax=Paracoccus nototheniae TaxID=2489002 RepID=A0ABW4DWE3_9RHOB|nr:MarR family transcriptional regulator [Paracoccus nototheniae]